MGYAHGQLFGSIATNVSNAVWGYFEEQVTSNLTFLPAWLADLIANYGLEVALDVIADLTAPSTPAHFLQELQGLADATGVDYKRLLRISLIGELTQGDCSMVGAWGPATAGGKTLAARALDWDTDIPAVQYPTVFIYHPEQGNGHAFANVGFVGWIGALSGQSSAQMSIHEIGVSYPDATFGNESFAGIPFVFLLRDILQYDNGLNDTIARITGANRTCDLILGAGSGSEGAFRAFEYSASVANVFDDTNQMPLASWHPRIPNMVYYGMDWLCPSYNSVLAAQLTNHSGALTPELIVSNVLPIVQTGDVHAVVYDLTDQRMYVSFYVTNASSVPTPVNAYDRAFTQLDLNALFAEPAPTAASVHAVFV